MGVCFIFCMNQHDELKQQQTSWTSLGLPLWYGLYNQEIGKYLEDNSRLSGPIVLRLGRCSWK